MAWSIFSTVSFIKFYNLNLNSDSMWIGTIWLTLVPIEGEMKKKNQMISSITNETFISNGNGGKGTNVPFSEKTHHQDLVYMSPMAINIATDLVGWRQQEAVRLRSTSLCIHRLRINQRDVSTANTLGEGGVINHLSIARILMLVIETMLPYVT